MISPAHQVIRLIDQPYRPIKSIVKVKASNQQSSNFDDILQQEINNQK
jgi:hypothetical protein